MKMRLIEEKAVHNIISTLYYQTNEFEQKIAFEKVGLKVKELPTIEAIPKADYEARLKADMVAMLTDIQLLIEDIVKEEELIDEKWANGLHYSEKVIQVKIDALKEK